ncbi:MAG: hypothetical protein QW796_02965 [Thermoproteota archaeon]
MKRHYHEGWETSRMTVVTKHRGRKSRSQPIQLTCHSCGYTWNYYGRIDRYGTNCPRCHGWVTIPFGIRKVPLKKSRQPTKPGVRVRCYKCGYEWTYTGIHVPRLLAGQRTVLICHACGSKIKL